MTPLLAIIAGIEPKARSSVRKSVTTRPSPVAMSILERKSYVENSFDMMCVENSMRGSAFLPTLAVPRAKKKRRKSRKKLRKQGFPQNARIFSGGMASEIPCKGGTCEAASPIWVQEDLRRKTMFPSDNLQGEELGVKKKKRRRLVKHLHGIAQQEQSVSTVDNGNDHQSDADTRVAISYVGALKACAKQRDLRGGRKLHKIVVRRGLLQNNVFIGSSLVSMYAKCGALELAQDVFDKLQQRNIVSWNALITGYAQHGQGKKALSCFERMQLEGFTADAVTFSSALKACGSTRDLDKGQEIHRLISKEQLLDKDVVVMNALVDMYAKCGALEKAQEIFDEPLARNIVSWTALITGYTQHGHGEDALRCFEEMQSSGVSPDAVTFASILKACGSIGALEKGEEIHAQLKNEFLLRKDVVIGNALVDMYIKCGALEKAQEAFDKLLVRNVVTWNGLLTGYSQHGLGKKALDCFEQMQREGFRPNAATFASILKACGLVRDSEKGKEIHAQIVRERLLERDKVAAGALVDMYVKCGNLEKAQEVFDELSLADVVSWTSLIAGYAEHGYDDKALNCFRQMQLAGYVPNAITFSCVLKVCGNIGALVEGQEIHAQIAKEKYFLEKDDVVGAALVDMYARCGAFVKAQEVLQSLSVLEVVSWNALIAGYAQHGHGKEAFTCFEQMQYEGFSPDAATFMCLLKACGSVGSAEMGFKVHTQIVKSGLMDRSTVLLDTSLVVMYANCGMLVEAEEVFGKLAVHDVVSWTALMAGYAQLGKDEIVLTLFEKMIRKGIMPTSVTFTILLNACSHRGLVEKGQFYFEFLSKAYDIAPTLEHHSCMVDLFGRAGHLDNAVALVEKMPFSADSATWHTLLGACRNLANKSLGRAIFEHALQLDENDDAAYVSMSDLFVAIGGSQEEAGKLTLTLCE